MQDYAIPNGRLWSEAKSLASKALDTRLDVDNSWIPKDLLAKTLAAQAWLLANTKVITNVFVCSFCKKQKQKKQNPIISYIHIFFWDGLQTWDKRMFEHIVRRSEPLIQYMSGKELTMLGIAVAEATAYGGAPHNPSLFGRIRHYVYSEAMKLTISNAELLALGQAFNKCRVVSIDKEV